MKKVLLRAATGSVYVGLITASLLIQDNILFSILFSIILVLGLNEFYTQISKATKIDNLVIDKIIDMLCGLTAFTFVNIGSPEFSVFSFALYAIVRLITALYTREKSPILGIAIGFMGQIYITLPLCMLAGICTTFSPALALAMFVFIWASDTGAFCVGCTIGKHKLFERISPKKSWEGFFGGLAFSIVLGVAAYYLLRGNANFEQLSIWIWIGFAAVVAIFSTLGDLVESLMKRSIGVKDFGNILPGHGGILDRIDSLLVVAPTTYLYLIILYSFQYL